MKCENCGRNEEPASSIAAASTAERRSIRSGQGDRDGGAAPDFRPEFLNRIDDIIVFRALTEQDIEEVTRRMLKTVAGRMETMDIHLDASDEAVKELAKEGFDPRYGARPLRRAIQSKVEDAVAVEDDKLVVTK